MKSKCSRKSYLKIVRLRRVFYTRQRVCGRFGHLYLHHLFESAGRRVHGCIGAYWKKRWYEIHMPVEEEASITIEHWCQSIWAICVTILKVPGENNLKSTDSNACVQMQSLFLMHAPLLMCLESPRTVFADNSLSPPSACNICPSSVLFVCAHLIIRKAPRIVKWLIDIDILQNARVTRSLRNILRNVILQNSLCFTEESHRLGMTLEELLLYELIDYWSTCWVVSAWPGKTHPYRLTNMFILT